jgi:hypothetical protein
VRAWACASFCCGLSTKNSTKPTVGDFATKLFEKARVATLSSSTSAHYDELARAEAEAAAANNRRRNKAAKSNKQPKNIKPDDD